MRNKMFLMILEFSKTIRRKFSAMRGKMENEEGVKTGKVKFHMQGLEFKVLGILFVLTTLITIVLSILGLNSTSTIITESSKNKLGYDVNIGLTLINNQFNGNWSIIGGKLWKGDFVLNNNDNIMNELKQEIGDSISIFQGDTVIATTIKDRNGKSAVGIKAPPEVVQTVLKQGKSYMSEATIAGQIYQTAYEPIKNGQEKVIGMWFVGVPVSNLVAQENLLRNETIGVGVLLLVVALFLGWLITKQAMKPLKNLVVFADRIGTGDFTELVAIQTHDEIGKLGESFNSMVLSLKSLISEIRSVSGQVAASSEQLEAIAEENKQTAEHISQTILETAAGTEEQVLHLQENVQIVTDITNGIQQIAKNSQIVSSSALEASDIAAKGNESVGHAIQQMNAIHQSVTGLSNQVAGLSEQTSQIGQIVDVITDIANQTNLLALNAAIEAARAGESGRGFSVVADEVRKLAEKSVLSAKQISTIIHTIQTETSEAVRSTEMSSKEVSEGLDKVNLAGEAFKRITDGIQVVVQEIQEVSAALQQMSASTEQLKERTLIVENVSMSSSDSMHTVSTTTEEQLASMMEITSSSSSLRKMAGQLQDLTDRFQV